MTDPNTVPLWLLKLAADAFISRWLIGDDRQAQGEVID